MAALGVILAIISFPLLEAVLLSLVPLSCFYRLSLTILSFLTFSRLFLDYHLSSHSWDPPSLALTFWAIISCLLSDLLFLVLISLHFWDLLSWALVTS